MLKSTIQWILSPEKNDVLRIVFHFRLCFATIEPCVDGYRVLLFRKKFLLRNCFLEVCSAHLPVLPHTFGMNLTNPAGLGLARLCPCSYFLARNKIWSQHKTTLGINSEHKRVQYISSILAILNSKIHIVLQLSLGALSLDFLYFLNMYANSIKIELQNVVRGVLVRV